MSRGEKGAVMRWVGVHITQGKARKRPASRWRSFKRNYFFFPVKGSRGRRAQSVYTLGEFLVPEIHERGREKRSLATTGALVKRARRRERARAKTCRCVRLDRAHKHERARAGLAGGRVERV
jgi:hypothetical protein